MTTNDRHQEAPDAGEVDPVALTEAERRMTVARVRAAADLTIDSVRRELGDVAADVVASSLHDHMASALAAATPAPAPQREADAPTQDGLHDKFRVERVAPSSRGIDHTGCRYFVLDPQHDSIAAFALGHYAARARAEGQVALADDLEAWLAKADAPTQDDVRERLALIVLGATRPWSFITSDEEDVADALLAAGVTLTPTDAGLRERVEKSPFVTISATLDAARSDDVSDGEHLWRRVTKVSEEAGEVWSALSGYVGENPRKGQTHTLEDLRGELLDAASAALCGWVHLGGNAEDPVPALLAHVQGTAERLAAALGDPS